MSKEKLFPFSIFFLTLLFNSAKISDAANCKAVGIASGVGDSISSAGGIVSTVGAVFPPAGIVGAGVGVIGSIVSGISGLFGGGCQGN